MQLSKLEDLLGFMERFTNQAAAHPANRCSEQLYSMEGLQRQKLGRAGRLLAKERAVSDMATFP